MSTRRAGGHYDATMRQRRNGERVPREATKISNFKHGLRYGDGVVRGVSPSQACPASALPWLGTVRRLRSVRPITVLLLVIPLTVTALPNAA